MFAGPIFQRELLTSPRRLRHFLMRSGYVAALFVLMYTAMQVTFGWQTLESLGDLARFGGLVFQIFAFLQLTLVLFFALLFAAGSVAQEKDRRTLVLLLMTDLRDRELVIGKLSASLLVVGVLLAVSVPVFAFVHLLGGVSPGQIVWAELICAAAALAAGSWGSLVAFWREKTFQTLAFSVLGLVLFIGGVEAVVAFAGRESPAGAWAALFSPYQAMIDVAFPLRRHTGLEPASVAAGGPVLALAGLSVVLLGATVLRLRVWNPSRFVFTRPEEQADDIQAADRPKAPIPARHIWSNPVIWREIRTRAYGRKTVVITLAYLVLAGVAWYAIAQAGGVGEKVMGMIPAAGFAFAGLAILSLMLVNAQAVTALTSERDGNTLELLLVTDITAKEFIYGKLGGILYNAAVLIAVPPALVVYFAASGFIIWEHALYVIASFAALVCFASMLGLHSGLSYDHSRAAIANSLGTMFFLFVGIFIFMILLVEASSSFLLQFQSFLLFIGLGSIGLYASLTHKNPSAALTISAGVLPFLTFYAITEYLLGGSLGVCLWILAAYGFTTIAMLVPAVSEFDVALGRTTLDQG
ncbi:MAG TPA: ABC transporter permease subunit [Planctomycetaceae bacterium]|nr:ABC transporter permease subunit [Planctomycetaceae bacterium]